MSTIKVTNVNPPTAGQAVNINGLAYPTAGTLGNRNLIINGAMDVTQRGTASVTATGQYPVDRFVTSFSVSSAAISSEVQEEAPAGLFRSLRYRMTTAATAGAAQVNNIQHKIEGTNIRHLKWGSANAQNVTLSFWVRSSNAGTYCVSLRNDAGETRRSYVAEYTIQAADTWERITIPIDGDTGGTWLTGAGLGVNITWDLGSGSNFNGTADSWLNNENRINTSNQFNFAGTTDAAFYLTGVQLEVGSVATPFEHRSYGDELVRCQRYYETGQADSTGVYISGAAVSIYGNISFMQTKRDTPNMSAPANWLTQSSAGGQTSRAFAAAAAYTTAFSAVFAGTDPRAGGSWSASAEL